MTRRLFVSLNLPFVETYRLEALGLLGDPTRRQIFELLTAGPLAVGELAHRLPVSRPAVSQHLRAMKEAGLVLDRAAGTRRIYQVDPSGVAGLRAYLDRVWGDALTAFQNAVAAEHGATKDISVAEPTATPKEGTKRESKKERS